MNNQEKNSYVRSHILQALLDKMGKEDFAGISICALTEAAGVGRASFYRNFKDKEDVLRQEAGRLSQVWQQRWERQQGTPSDFSSSLLNFYKENAAFYLTLYRAGLGRLILDNFLQNAGIGPGLPNAVAYLKSAMAYMVYGWVIEWMHRGMQESGTELAQMLRVAQEKNAFMPGKEGSAPQ